jgi:NAD(P)-dependent dehydrogenase (short-subunit alcohol dehydrogenase family)
MPRDFDGRHLVVTGGTGALGTAVVGLLIEQGATCHIPAASKDELKRFPYTGQCRIAEGIDLTDEPAVESFYGRFDGPSAPQLWGSIHIAGGFAMSAAAKTSKSDFLNQFNTNALTCFLCCREAVRRMPGSGGGRIVNVAARPALSPEQGGGMVAYTASKAAVAAITQALAAEVAAQGILVNAVVPSIMDTPANRRSMPSADYSKWPKVEDVAATIFFLASPRNTVTRGGLVPVYGKS